jgi:hypothetical protein
MKRIGKQVLAAGMVVLCCALWFFAGYRFGLVAGAMEDDPIAQAESHLAGRMTFCEIGEQARLHACPVLRKAMPYGGGAVVLYVCDPGGTRSYVEMLGLSAEARTQVVARFLESGFRVEPYCGRPDKEVVALKVPWKATPIR